MALEQKPFIGKGIPYIGLPNLIKNDAGNCSGCTFSYEEEEKSLLNYRAAGGGDYASLKRFKSVSMALKLHDANKVNLALTQRGTANTVTAGTVTNEIAKGWNGGFVNTLFLIDTTVTPVVTGAGGTPSFTLGTHFTVSAGGISIISLPGGFTDGSNIEIDYTKKASTTIEGLTSSGQEYELVIDGLNEADSGKAVRLTVYKWKPGLPGSFDLIGDEFGVFELSGKLTADTSKGVGLSQYFRIDYV